jgi:transcriptional regulator with XRE-family HTH domain
MIPMERKSPIDTHIGQRLKEYRQHRAMTVRELADAAHVTPGQISRYEHGRDRISHERVTEFARILRIKSNDLYQPPGSRLRRNHVRWRLTNFVAAVIAEAAALMSSRRKAAADNEATMAAAVAVAVGASAAAASDAGAGEKSSLTTSADDTAVDMHASDAANALLIMDGANTGGGKVAYDPPMSAAGEQASAQSTPAENGFIVSNPFPFTETASGNKDHSGFQFKPSMDHHAVTDPEINDITKEHPEQPAHPHSDNFTCADDDGSAHPGHATGKAKDISVQPSADPKIGDIAKEHPEHPHSDVNQLASFKFVDEGSADSRHLAHPHFDNAKVPGTMMSDAASDQFVFEKGQDKVAAVKPDMIETDHAVADIRHLLHTAHDANAVGALDPNHTTAPQDMTKVQLPHHHGDFHLA